MINVLHRWRGVRGWIETTRRYMAQRVAEAVRREGERLVISGSFSDVSIPVSLRDLLVGRLDRLGYVAEHVVSGGLSLAAAA